MYQHIPLAYEVCGALAEVASEWYTGDTHHVPHQFSLSTSIVGDCNRLKRDIIHNV